jgi:hypothetical protein
MTIYVLVPSVLETDPASGSPGLLEEQWWCMSWGPPKPSTGGWDDTSTLSYEVKKVTEGQVLHAARTTGDGNVLLVYASDEAVHPSEGIDAPLPIPLQVCLPTQLLRRKETSLLTHFHVEFC